MQYITWFGPRGGRAPWTRTGRHGLVTVRVKYGWIGRRPRWITKIGANFTKDRRTRLSSVIQAFICMNSFRRLANPGSATAVNQPLYYGSSFQHRAIKRSCNFKYVAIWELPLPISKIARTWRTLLKSHLWNGSINCPFADWGCAKGNAYLSCWSVDLLRSMNSCQGICVCSRMRRQVACIVCGRGSEVGRR